MGFKLKKTVRSIARATMGVDRRPPADQLIRAEALQTKALHPERLRLVSYNIKAGLHTSTGKVQEALEQLDADVIALQEVDHQVERSGLEDQTARFSRALCAHGIFAAATERGGGLYGIALLSRLPIQRVERHEITTRFSAETRVVIEAELKLGGSSLRVFATHTDFLPWSATSNIKALTSRVKPAVGYGALVMGDLNSPPWFPGPRALVSLGLSDAIARFDEGPTFTDDLWKRRLDYILADPLVAKCFMGAQRIESKASDHRPIVLDLDRRGLEDALLRKRAMSAQNVP